MSPAPPAPRAVSLSVRPCKVAHLCFEVDGILGESKAQLGSQVNRFDFHTFYTDLKAFESSPSWNALDSSALEALVDSHVLVALRAEPRKAALDRAIYVGQNAWFAKYANAPAIISKMNEYYSPSTAGSKPWRLANLERIAKEQANGLKTAYTKDKKMGVVRHTVSVLRSRTKSTGSSKVTGQSNQDSVEDGAVSAVLPALPKGGAPLINEGGEPQMIFQQGTSGEKSDSKDLAIEHQRIVNTDYGYRMPNLENAAQNHRALISLMDQQFAQFMFGQNLSNLPQVFQNELNSIYTDIYRLQVALLNTILMSPIDGMVTGIYKYPGDAVRAGEPVVRVENDSTIFLMATVIYGGPIVVCPPGATPPRNSTVTVTTSLFDSATSQVLTGSVVSARGHHDDNKWDLIVQCNNLDASGNPIFPLGYHFDYDDTTVSIA
jgi:hypothetical protein